MSTAGAPCVPARDDVIVVTGGGRGIGAALVGHLAALGIRVVIADVLDTESAALAERSQAEGHSVDFEHTDVACPSSTRALAAAVLARYGRIDALINNAAIYAGIGGKKHFTDISTEEWDRVMAVNTKGAWLMTAAVFPAMKARHQGAVVNVASATVHAGVPFFAHYTASKGAVIALTRSIAKEVGREGITVNAVAPGLVDNESSALLNESAYLPAVAGARAIPRNMTPADLCGAVSFLCSPASRFITGQTVIVDGGLSFT
ncbi:SDR family NAD(P)-dependent oxidoreductase [Mycobacterium sp. 3519A]|uniref:SDR family NAD(P)-dependent oxidoreductase n=1 Tax=Mycobacterium sp. 3519A TaxID=2057184 RepID=UPI000C79658B|nr:SDR family oxidoreductase [Mycobacterium sp. 3519A]